MREEYENWFQAQYGIPPMLYGCNQHDFCWEGYKAGQEALRQQLAILTGEARHYIAKSDDQDMYISKLEQQLVAALAAIKVKDGALRFYKSALRAHDEKLLAQYQRKP